MSTHSDRWLARPFWAAAFPAAFSLAVQSLAVQSLAVRSFAVRSFAALFFAALSFTALGAATGEVLAAEGGGERELYRWLDRNGVVRYTPDLSRIPDTRRKTVIRVVAGTNPHGEPLPSVPLPASSTRTLAPLGPALAGADPFNAPAEARQVETQQLPADAEFGGESWPELNARIAELEILISADEEILMEMISAPRSDGGDDLIHSPALRQVAARLPILQGELNELRRWREQPGNR